MYLSPFKSVYTKDGKFNKTMLQLWIRDFRSRYIVPSYGMLKKTRTTDIAKYSDAHYSVKAMGLLEAEIILVDGYYCEMKRNDIDALISFHENIILKAAENNIQLNVEKLCDKMAASDDLKEYCKGLMYMTFSGADRIELMSICYRLRDCLNDIKLHDQKVSACA